jgi:hypothetical protein
MEPKASLLFSHQPAVGSSPDQDESRSEVFTVMKIQFMVFWVVMPCSGMVGYHPFGGLCCLHLGGEVMETMWSSKTLVSNCITTGITSQKTTTSGEFSQHCIPLRYSLILFHPCLGLLNGFIIQFSTASYYFLSHRSKYSSQQPVFKHPQSIIFP